jgi:hypothetical protein
LLTPPSGQELITDVAAFQAASDRIRALNDKHHEALSNGDRTFLLFRDPADLYDVEEMPDVEPDAESETRPSNAIDRTAVSVESVPGLWRI